MGYPESTLGSIDHDIQVGGIRPVILKIEDMDLEELEGQIKNVADTNEENGYTVARVRLLNAAAAKPGTGTLWHQGRENLVTVVGTLVSPTPGELIRMKGEWSLHPRFCRQFKIVESKTHISVTAERIERYLGSGLGKGIGPEMAKRIGMIRKAREEQ